MKIVNYVLIVSSFVFIYLFPFYWYVCTLNDLNFEDTSGTEWAVRSTFRPLDSVVCEHSWSICWFSVLFSFISIIVISGMRLQPNSLPTAVRISHSGLVQISHSFFTLDLARFSRYAPFIYVSMKIEWKCAIKVFILQLSTWSTTWHWAQKNWTLILCAHFRIEKGHLLSIWKRNSWKLADATKSMQITLSRFE